MQAPQPAKARNEQRANSRNPHGRLNMPCENCHTFTSWKPIRNLPEFSHDKTSYPLRGMHVGVACRQCHTDLVFSNVGNKCADCHADIHRGQFAATCDQCHTVKGWRISLQEIKQHQNRFPLVGAHAVAPCESCHTGAAVSQFRGLSTECVTCHAGAFAATTSPDHRAANFPSTCQQCHSMDSWLGARFDHAQYAGFALTGAHATLDCASCHVGGRYQGTSANCFGCHSAEFSGTTNPNHIQAGFPQDCARCHSTASWTGARFDHTAFTQFPLTGAHVNALCSQCHTGGRFAGTPTDCASCHLTDFQQTTNPNHVQAGFPQNCSICHTTAQWQGAQFDHSRTRLPLTGAHAQVACSSCHVNGRYAGLDPTCVSCHLTNYQQTTNPNHVQAGFPQDCAVCHTAVGWTPASFNHSTTAFPLTGAHTQAACSSCHINGRYAGTPTTCVSCHLTNFQQTTNPNHVQAGFPQDCSICHTTAQWQGAQFDHSRTLFPLTGAHTTAACASCHINGRFTGTPRDCASCHLTDFQQTTNPNHVQAGFPQDCSICHTTAQWQGAQFDHSRTAFPLTGSHTTAACASCHINGRFAGTPTACVSCHLTNYQQTTNPNHAQAGFPQDCVVCHSTAAWTPASFNHNATAFPLTGAHTQALCSKCHINGRYAGTPTDCYSCHRTEFTAATTPNHVAAGFPTTCNQCHTTASWLGATFNHTWFPIYSGAHRGRWTTCNDCHVNPSNFTVFSCLTCHEHNKTSMDQKHSGVRNYVYNSSNCYSCHPQGRS